MWFMLIDTDLIPIHYGKTDTPGPNHSWSSGFIPLDMSPKTVSQGPCEQKEGY